MNYQSRMFCEIPIQPIACIGFLDEIDPSSCQSHTHVLTLGESILTDSGDCVYIAKNKNGIINASLILAYNDFVFLN